MDITASAASTINYYPISSWGNNAINNITLTAVSTISGNANFTAGIIAYSSSMLELGGTIIVDNKSNVTEVHGMYAYHGATINSNADIYTNSIKVYKSAVNLNSGIVNLQGNTVGLSCADNSSLYIGSETTLNISAKASALTLSNKSMATVLGKINLDGQSTAIRAVDSILIALPSAEFNLKTTGSVFECSNGGNFIFSAGVKLNVKDASGEAYLTTGRYLNMSSSVTSASLKNTDGLKYNSSAKKINWQEWKSTKDAPQASKTDNYDQQYSEIIGQYDAIINDADYKGTNLFKENKLKVNFNETGSSELNVAGKDMSTTSLGLTTVAWTNQGDIEQSLRELANVLTSIREFTAELGNNYSIITKRQEFTENLINILTEGADKLTLADMNEESANMLAAQTRQQLAINSLSLSSQAARSVLKLF